MREIKFRGLNGAKTEWIYADLYTVSKQFLYNGVWKDTVGQCTGLKDKNGKEIWEGDVCRAIANTRVPLDPFAVIWNNEYAQWFWKDLKGEDEFWKSIAERSEVIGNIHDNPELLGEQL